MTDLYQFISRISICTHRHSDTVISGQTVPEKTQCGKIGLWLLEGSIITNISEYTTLGSRFEKPYRENSRSAAPG